MTFPFAFCFAISVAVLLFVAEGEGEDEGEDLLTICAFCFRTSAGVRRRQEIISPALDERLFITGAGIERSHGDEEFVDALLSVDFTDSYVVKNAPAAPTSQISQPIIPI